MTDLICRNTMQRCQTPGMCSPHGGCRPEHDTEPSTIANAKPHETYEGLRRQFMALRTLAASNEAIAANMSRQLKDQSQTLADLDAERNTNALLTETVAELEAQRDQFKAQLDRVAAIVGWDKDREEAGETIVSCVVEVKNACAGLQAAWEQECEKVDALDAENAKLRGPAARYTWLRDNPWPGACRQVGIVHRDREHIWLDGDEADRAIDAEMAPPSDDIPDFGGGGGNSARRRAAALGVDMDASLKAGATIPLRPWKEIAEPVADADRKCRVPDCWNCEGTGRDPNGGLCLLNDGLPF